MNVKRIHFEDRFGVEFADSELERVKTVGQMIALAETTIGGAA